MAQATPKITLATSRDIPFNKLVLSQSNVRRLKAGISVDELAESIARRGLIQSLHVRPVLGENGAETGLFEVPAGGRRFRALDLLVKQRRLPKTVPVPCIVSEATDAVLIDELSLAENIERAPLHPLDQFRAFQAMRDKGMSEEAIAAAFFVDAKVVKQRLRLAAVSPALLDVYADDGMTLEQLMAFTVSADHDRQDHVWAAVKDAWSKEPYQIRRMLTETTVRANDKRVQFLGLDAYEAAGGYVLRDLFQQDDGGWLQDPVLLDRLVSEKLATEAAVVAAEGWKWIEVSVSFPYGHTQGLRALRGTVAELSEAEYASREALRAAYDRLETEHAGEDDLPDDIDQRLGEIEAALAAFGTRPVTYPPEDIARAGAFISIDMRGGLLVDRGYVRAEDDIDDAAAEGVIDPATGEQVATAAVSNAVPADTIPQDGSAHQSEDDDSDTVKPLPERLVIELTAHRTLALRDAVANNPRIALTALLQRLVLDCFGARAPGGVLQARVNEVHFPAQSPDLADTPAARSIDERHANWQAELPLADDDRLWDRLHGLDEASRQALLAHCLSFGINALYERPNPYSGMGVSQHGLDRRLREADRLARATKLDLVETGWRPTVTNYLGRVTKAHIIAAVREGAGEGAAQLIDHLKKDDMAREAERLLAGRGWLPVPLRMEDTAAGSDTSGDDVDEALPAFLEDSIAAHVAAVDGQVSLIAAE